MILVEYEAKALLRTLGLPIPAGHVVSTPDEARRAAEALAAPVVIKAQIPIGGRMKVGGVAFADTPAEAEAHAQRLLGSEIRGFLVERLLVETRLGITREVFAAATYDTTTRRAALIASVEGGIDVEGTSTLVQQPFSLLSPMIEYQGRDLAAALGLRGLELVQLGGLFRQIATAFVQLDALLLECNPVIINADGRCWVADVHFEVDDDALSRQKALVAAAPYSVSLANRRSDFEQRAIAIDQADHRGVAGRLIPFGGNIGVLIGGGGASLTTMDALLDAGLSPANYCEIGGNPSVWKIKELTKLILSQPQVDKLIVIMNVVSNTRVDLIARGVIKGILEHGLNPSDVLAAFRVPGSWEDEGRKILDHYGVRAFGRETSIEQVVEFDMTILVHADTRIIVQGITGREAATFTRESIAYGARIVAGVTPGRGGNDVHGVPVFDTVQGALAVHPADATVISVPAAYVLDAACESLAHGIKLVVILTERIPRRDVTSILEHAEAANARVIGPNSLGIIAPGVTRIGMAGGSAEAVRRAYLPGRIAVVSRSGGMMTEIANLLTLSGIGQSTCVSIGGDPIIGSTLLDLLPLYEADPDTDAIVTFCEPGGTMEERLAQRLAQQPSRLPIIAFVAGRFADQRQGIRFGHAGAIVEGSKGSPAAKIEALRTAGVLVADRLAQIPALVRQSTR